MASSCWILVPYRQDPFDVLAGHLLSHHTTRLPDLSRVVILLPELSAASRLCRTLFERLAQRNIRALIGPQIMTLRLWISQNTPTALPAMTDHAKHIMLVEALRSHPKLFGGQDPWLLAENLISLFDELTLHSATLPDALEEFVARLGAAYGASTSNMGGLHQEAHLVHTLWQAWHRQQIAESHIDKNAAYIAGLMTATDFSDGLSFYFIGGADLVPAEIRWLKTAMEQDRLTCLMPGQLTEGVDEQDYHPDAVAQGIYRHFGPPQKTECIEDGYGEFLDAVYAPETRLSMRIRARDFAGRYAASPLEARLHVYAADNFEQEAQAVDIQVRRWLLSGKNSIGIITEDRRLARRVRALLERADVMLNDLSGWALSTTSAAAALERWLEAVEEDFACQPLVDVLKSPFTTLDMGTELLKADTYLFEQDIILHGNIMRGIRRYRSHLGERAKENGYEHESRLKTLLDKFESAAAPLISLTRSSRTYDPAHFIEAVEKSLERLGMMRSFAQDAAGNRLLGELKHMRNAVRDRYLAMTWMEFRAWLAQTLEKSNFLVEQNTAPVVLLNLRQSQMHRYDAVIIAGADDRHFPGESSHGPFFNNAVRHELGLPVTRRRLTEQFYLFRRLLQAGNEILITMHKDENGEALAPSPWLEALQSFHRLAYDRPIHDGDMGLYIAHPDVHVRHIDATSMPSAGARPAPAIEKDFVPATLSATGHQELMNCPYLFFVSRCLRISPLERITEILEKPDFGNKVHKILHAFHSGIKGLPGPYPNTFSEKTRDEAISCLQDISRAVFADDVKENFIHRDWLNRWMLAIPQYIDWQIARSHEWTVYKTESPERRENYYRGLSIEGRLDRIDRGTNGLAIVDYKTGAVPRPADVESGEAVQLPFYAMLSAEPIYRAEYLSIDKEVVKSKTPIEGEELAMLAHATQNRLQEIHDGLLDGAALPAWGDDDICEKCSYDGICRKQAWLNPA